LTALDRVLELVAPKPEDTIVTLGDYVNRGPDSRGVIERLLELGQQCTLVPLLGNHDETFLEVLLEKLPLDGLLEMHGDTTLESYGCQGNLNVVPPEHVVFLTNCQMHYETERHFFVHANYAPNQPLTNQTRIDLLWRSLRDGKPAEHYSKKQAILGHTPQRDGIPLNRGHFVCIDTGCVYGGVLTALDVMDGTLWQAGNE
jgi:serine/threonine protein phosphatase 1